MLLEIGGAAATSGGVSLNKLDERLERELLHQIIPEWGGV